MEVLQPLMLWGAGAVLIPVIIHFWHQKKGKKLDWAATRWLQEKDQQQQRGYKLDNLLLLILRCLIVILLAFVLSQPVFRWFSETPAIQKIHLVQPEKIVVDNFRFELKKAIEKGEAVYWINSATQPVDDPAQLPNQRLFTTGLLQSSINTLQNGQSEFHLYLITNQRLAEVPFIRVPATYKLHAIVDSANRPIQNYLEFSATKKLYVDPANRLINRPVLDPAIRFQPNPVHTGPLTIWVDFRDAIERQTVLAALNALSDVYALDLQIDTSTTSGRKYDLVLTDRNASNPLPETLYIISGQLKTSTASHVVYIDDKLTPKTAEMVRTGQLPEWVGEQVMQHFKLKTDSFPLSQAQLKALFVTTAQPEGPQPENHRNWLVLVFVILTGAERWIALRKNA